MIVFSRSFLDKKFSIASDALLLLSNMPDNYIQMFSISKHCTFKLACQIIKLSNLNALHLLQHAFNACFPHSLEASSCLGPSISSALARQGCLLRDAAGSWLSVWQQMRDALPLPDQLILALQDLFPHPVINSKVIADMAPALALHCMHVRLNTAQAAVEHDTSLNGTSRHVAERVWRSGVRSLEAQAPRGQCQDSMGTGGFAT